MEPLKSSWVDSCFFLSPCFSPVFQGFVGVPQICLTSLPDAIEEIFLFFFFPWLNIQGWKTDNNLKKIPAVLLQDTVVNSDKVCLQTYGGLLEQSKLCCLFDPDHHLGAKSSAQCVAAREAAHLAWINRGFPLTELSSLAGSQMTTANDSSHCSSPTPVSEEVFACVSDRHHDNRITIVHRMHRGNMYRTCVCCWSCLSIRNVQHLYSSRGRLAWLAQLGVVSHRDQIRMGEIRDRGWGWGWGWAWSHGHSGNDK